MRFRCAQFSYQQVPCLKVFRSVAEPAAFGDGSETGRIRFFFRSVAGPVAFGDGAEVQFVCFVGLAALAVFAFGEFGRLAVLIGCLCWIPEHFVQTVNIARGKSVAAGTLEKLSFASYLLV